MQSDATPHSESGPPATWRRVMMRLLLAGFCAGIVFLAIFAAGFLVFIDQVAESETEFGKSADGVVALTGGAERIADALSVLEEGRARRLLITGVNNQTSGGDLARTAGHSNLFHCCVDIDRHALNTVGNAAETRKWVRRHHYKSLIVVTSNYHMPRALLELERHLDGVELIPHPVVTEGTHPDRWWHDPAGARLLVAEYAKLLAASVRRWFRPKAD